MMDFSQYRSQLEGIRKALGEAGEALHIDHLREQISELSEEMNQPEFWNDLERSTKVNQKLGNLKNRVAHYEKLLSSADDVEVMMSLAQEENDEDMAGEIEGELAQLQEHTDQLTLETMMRGDYDDKPAVLSLHAGAGGTEAQDWTQMLYRMYTRYCENMGFTIKVLDFLEGDEAGIKAAIKGVDMLLKQDLNIKVLVLPSPEDPDSFAQNHSASEITEYINQNEQDFIDFKTDVLLKDCERDPIARAKAIESVLRSVANIPNQITRNVYAQVCVNKFHLSESVIVNQIERYRAQIKEEDWKNEERERKQRELDAKRKVEATTTAVEVSGQGAPLPPPPFDVNIPPASYPQEVPATQPPVPQPAPSFQQQPSAHESALQKCEYEVIQYMVKYGCSFIFEYEQLTVIEWLTKEITDDNHRFTIPLYQKLYKLCQELFSDFTVAFSNFMQSVEEKKHQLYTQEIEQFRSSFEGNVAEIERKEEEAKQSVDAQFENEISEYRQNFIFKHLSSHPDDDVREIVNEICLPKHSLSKIHAEIFSQHMDSQRLLALVSASLFNWKLTIIEIKISQLETELKSATIDRQFEILKKIQELTTYRKELAKLTGERVVNPKNLN